MQKRGTGVGIQGTNSRALPCHLLIPVPHPALQLVAAIMLVCCRDVLKADIKTSSLNYFRKLLIWASHKWQIFGGKLVSRAHHVPLHPCFLFPFILLSLIGSRSWELVVPVSRAAAEVCQKCSDRKKARFSAAPGLLPAVG